METLNNKKSRGGKKKAIISGDVKPVQMAPPKPRGKKSVGVNTQEVIPPQ